jgi:hypothetical protein
MSISSSQVTRTHPNPSLSDPNQYLSQCQSLLEQMINTVPHGVSLTEEIALIPAKVSDVQLTVEKNQLVFKTNFRVRYVPW